MGNNSIPDRWLNYSSVGKPIPGTRFFAFKVPLRTPIANKVEPTKRFTPMDLIEQVPNLGLVIDLTNTKRYYDQREIIDHGVEYLKVACVGRTLPSSAVINKFLKAVDKFLEENADNDKLIGIHCTHGVNRTGFFICKYMIDKMKSNPLTAISKFEEARGHKMERDVYIMDLINGPDLAETKSLKELPTDLHTIPIHSKSHNRLANFKSHSKDGKSFSSHIRESHNDSRPSASSSVGPRHATPHSQPRIVENWRDHPNNNNDTRRNSHNSSNYGNDRPNPPPRQSNTPHIPPQRDNWRNRPNDNNDIQGNYINPQNYRYVPSPRPNNTPYLPTPRPNIPRNHSTDSSVIEGNNRNYQNYDNGRNNLSARQNHTTDANRQYPSQRDHSNRFYKPGMVPRRGYQASSLHNVNNSRSSNSQQYNSTSEKYYRNPSRQANPQPQ